MTANYRLCRKNIAQNKLFIYERSEPKPVVTYERIRVIEAHPVPAPDVAFLLPDGEVSWSCLLLSKFARLMKVADAQVHLPRRGLQRLTGVQGPAAF